MPKETFHDQADLYDVVVGWEREMQHLQVGIQSRDGQPLAEHLTASDGESAGFRSVWGTLDRAACNRLIRALRHARDQAFGRDE